MDESIKVLVVRHPDQATEVAVWVDELPAMNAEVTVVDPGAGYELSGWRGQLAAALARADLPTAMAARLRAVYESYESSEFIRDDDEQDSVETYCGRFHNGKWCTWSVLGHNVDAAAAALREHWDTNA